MKTNKILAAALAFTLTVGAVMPVGGNVSEYSITANAENTTTTYAHNYDYVAVDLSQGPSVDPRLKRSKSIDFDKDMVCALSVCFTNENISICTDYFVEKEFYEKIKSGDVRLCATYGYSSQRKFLLLWSDSEGNIIGPVGGIDYQTTVTKTESGDEISGPTKVDWRYETRAFVGENETLYCNKEAMPIYFYSLGGNPDWDWTYRSPEKNIGILQKDGSIKLHNHIIRFGDVNHDNKIDIEDVVAIMNHINGISALDDKYIWAADVNDDGVVDIEDTVIINNHINGIKPLEEKYKDYSSDTKTAKITTAAITYTTNTTTKSSSSAITNTTTTTPKSSSSAIVNTTTTKPISSSASSTAISGTVPTTTDSKTAYVSTDATVSFDQETGTLTLRGNVTKDAVKEVVPFKSESKVLKVTAEKGTVFPKDSSELFKSFKKCVEFDLANADTSKVTNMGQMFEGCEEAVKIDVSKFDTSNAEAFSYMFGNCQKLKKIDVSKFDTKNILYFNGMFSGCESLESIDLSNFNTEKAVSLSQMFYGCKSMKKIDVSKFNTSNAEDMSGIFTKCESLEKIDLTNFDTKKAKQIQQLFMGCKNLKSVDVSSFDTSNAEEMYNLFADCSSIEEIDISNFNCEKVRDFEYNFYNCTSLKKLNMKGVNPKNAQLAMGNFENCKSIEELDLSDFGCEPEYANGSFRNCENLKKLNISKWDLTKLNKVIEKHYDKNSTLYGSYNADHFIGANKLEEITIGGGDIQKEMKLHNSNGGWVNAKAKDKKVSGDDEFAEIKNEGVNTYIFASETTTATQSADKTTYGDVNIDGKVNASDVTLLLRYMKDQKNNPLSEQALKNANVFKPDDPDITEDDSEAILQFIAKTIDKLPINAFPIKGDANCDKEVNLADSVLIMQSISNPSKYGEDGTNENHITADGKNNADVYNPGDGITNKDALSIQKYKLSLIESLPEIIK